MIQQLTVHAMVMGLIPTRELISTNVLENQTKSGERSVLTLSLATLL